MPTDSAGDTNRVHCSQQGVREGGGEGGKVVGVLVVMVEWRVEKILHEEVTSCEC